MFETTVTVIGRLVTPLKQIWFQDGTFMVSGRMACTERRYDRGAAQWTDGQTFYVTVVCRRGLAENAFSSLRSLDPVIAHGRLYTREYEKDGVQNRITEMEAWSIGPDLQRCTAVLTKKSRSAAPPPQTAAAGDDPWGSGDPAAHGDSENGRPASDGEADADEVLSDDPRRDAEPAGVRAAEAAVGV